MSDIDLFGVFAAFIGLALLGLALVWALGAIVVVRVRARERFGSRLLRALVGPAICSAAGLLLLAPNFLGAGGATARAADELALFAAPGAPLLAIAATLWAVRRPSDE